MLRNIRNMIKAGISEKHHNIILKKIADEGAVRSSKQSSFRFFSAYDVLKELDEELDDKPVVEGPSSSTGGLRGGRGGRGGRGNQDGGRGGRGKGGGGRGGRGAAGRDKSRGRKGAFGKDSDNQSTPSKVKPPFTKELINRYRKSLDKAVRIATIFNTKQIPGRTVIYIDLGTDRFGNLPKAAKGLGKSVRSPNELAYLLATSRT